MGDEIPVQLYRSFLMIIQDGEEKKHGIKKTNISRYGVRWRRFNNEWGQRAIDIHSEIDRNPHNGELYVEALEFIGEVFINNTFGMERNHYNYASFASMVNDAVDYLVNDKPRVMSALSWEKLLTADDPEQRKDLSNEGLAFNFDWVKLDKMTKTPAKVLDILCVINTLTKL